ncbi:MAG: hypothetical protein KAQ83_01085 [Nanoarchaeota archaeon]|nr:hypothetical protein [Nanoarchaeota archaeon]
MAFKLFNKDKYSSSDIPEVPDLGIPEPPQSGDLPELPDMDIPAPPKMDSISSKSDDDLAMPDFDVPKIKEEKPMSIPVPRRDDNDLPDFPNAEIVRDREVPEPPAFFSKMDDVKRDMDGGYMEHGTNIVKLNRPIFVEVKDYKKILRTIKTIERDAKKSKGIAMELEEVKTKREKHLEGWDKKLENIQRSLIFADKILFEDGGVNV